MAAPIRRTLSPVPRAGGLQSGEVCSAPSPLSKSSPCTQNYAASGGLLSSLFSSLDSKGLVNGVLSHRSNKTLERSKYKGQLWRRAVWHFFICFLVGVFMGLTPIVSKNLSMSKNQAFTFEAMSTVENVEAGDNISSSNDGLQIGSGDNNAISEPVKTDLDFLDDSVVVEPENQTVNGDSTVLLQKLLIVVTPTYTQPLQAYYLNRLAQTLKLVPPPLLWIVVEMTSQSGETADILRKTGLMYRHLVCGKNITDKEDRRVHQRNAALSHIETHRLDGIVIFADVENIYLIDLFEQIRRIRRFGTWVVGRSTNFRGEVVMEGPVCNASQVIGWHTKISNTRYRRFHAEMPGFAFNSTILWDPKRWHRPTMERVRQLDRVRESSKASTFVEQIVEDESQMEALEQDCSRIMVWRLQLESSISSYPQNWFIKNNLYAKVPLL